MLGLSQRTVKRERPSHAAAICDCNVWVCVVFLPQGEPQISKPGGKGCRKPLVLLLDNTQSRAPGAVLRFRVLLGAAVVNVWARITKSGF
jgi:hypothetical protein